MIIFVLFIGCGTRTSNSAEKDIISDDFISFVESCENKTQIQKDEYIGTYVLWTGTVADVSKKNDIF